MNEGRLPVVPAGSLPIPCDRVAPRQAASASSFSLQSMQ